MKNNFVIRARELVSLGDKFIKNFGSDKFHFEAARLLEESQMHELFNFRNLIETSFSKSFNHHQKYKNLEFSDLPLTIARGNDCFIDVYFWRRRPTVIHNHHFNGAFQCLEGLNIDSEFKFKTIKKLTKHHSLGELQLKRTVILKKGDIERINFLDKFIHQNHHQADLTVNLCFRTLDAPQKNLSNYLFSGLKFEKDQGSIERAQRIFAFARIDDFDHRKLNITLIDAINFLIIFHGSSVSHTRFLKLKKFLEAKVKSETGIKVTELLEKHDRELERIESDYE